MNTERLDAIEARSAGLTDLCAEHLRQSIRHVQRNCDIDCNTHEDDYEACKQPDRYDGDRMAAVLADVPFLLDLARKQQAALDAVRGVHEPFDAVMYSGSQQRMVKVCTGCGTDDGNWQRWPCPSIKALEAKP